MPPAAVGDTASIETTLSAADVERFAGITGDENPVHLDDDYAAETVFEGRVAHGILTAGVVSAALAKLPGDVVYLAQDLAFDAPVYPGDTVRAEVRVTEVLDGDRLEVETVATVPDRDERVISGTATVLSLPMATPAE